MKSLNCKTNSNYFKTWCRKNWICQLTLRFNPDYSRI